MSGTALLDVNVLVALFNPDHVHHEVAHDWFADNRARGWATCAITENGFVRILAKAGARASLRSVEILSRLRSFCATDDHVFWADAVSLTNSAVFNLSFVQGHRQVTDIYLLGLAKFMSGCLITFDRAIPLRSVVGATAATIQVIAPAE